jgi:putative Mg2+ transporter-C (MgtC) family protein
MDLIDFDIETGLRLLISFTIGTIIGFEREYHSKAAGLRTMIMICLGSTIFTLVSLSIGGASPDRIASNVITGIGFLGAGVIFKDGLTISGITTATTIWISAAIGMAVGAGEYFIAMAGSVIVLLVLSALQEITYKIERFHQMRNYRVSYVGNEQFINELEESIRNHRLKFVRKKDFKETDCLVAVYEIRGKERDLDTFNIFLKNHHKVKAFEF